MRDAWFEIKMSKSFWAPFDSFQKNLNNSNQNLLETSKNKWRAFAIRKSEQKFDKMIKDEIIAFKILYIYSFLPRDPQRLIIS